MIFRVPSGYVRVVAISLFVLLSRRQRHRREVDSSMVLVLGIWLGVARFVVLHLRACGLVRALLS